MKKLKIGLFIDTYYPLIDGVVVVVDNYARNLCKKADVVVICPSEDDNYIDNFPYRVIRVKGIHVPLTKYKLSVLTNKLKKQLKDEHFDIIHIHSPFTLGKLGVEIAHDSNIPVIATMHSQFKTEFKRYTKSNFISDRMIDIIMKVYNKCDECWAVNSSVAEVFKEYGYKGKIKVMNNATDLVLQNDTTDVDKKYNLDKNDLLFLFVGRITIIKNILFILEVLKILKDRNIKFKMLYVGPSQDNQILQNKINEYKLNDMVKIEEPIKDRILLAKLYKRAYLFMFPSLFDASSLVQIEAASQKTPTIFIDGSVTSATVRNDIDGFMAPNDPVLFADKVVEVINNKDLYKNVCENAYKYVYCTWEKASDYVLDNYIKVIKER